MTQWNIELFHTTKTLLWRNRYNIFFLNYTFVSLSLGVYLTFDTRPQTTINSFAYIYIYIVKFTDNSVLLMVTLDAVFNNDLTNPNHPDTVTMKNTLIQQVDDSQTPLFAIQTFESVSVFVYSHSISWVIQDIKNNAWVTVNNDFWVTSEAICQ